MVVAKTSNGTKQAMSSLKIYGIARTRAFRALWMAKELGLDYEHDPVEIGDAGARTPEFLAINPNGEKVEVIHADAFEYLPPEPMKPSCRNAGLSCSNRSRTAA